MKMYVGVTDGNWFNSLKERNAAEVNFWKPSATNFKALNKNDLFLFKLHSPNNFIVGGGFFVHFSILPSFLAWQAFGENNGAKSLEELNKRLKLYRTKNKMNDENFDIGCIILTDVFYFERNEWIPIPSDWSNNIVSGKSYTLDTQVGKVLFRQVEDRRQALNSINIEEGFASYVQENNRYYQTMTRHRIGQGAFRILVTDAYKRRCAITGEKTLPVLEAAHVKPFSREGPNDIKNGLLLKSDFHTLFDDGYITVDKDYKINVSKKLYNDYGNGKYYYKFHGERLIFLPDALREHPSEEFLTWHNENVYVG